jgi:hypothetical protein
MTEKKQPQPITMEPIAHRAHFVDRLTDPLFVQVLGVDGLGNLLRFIDNNRTTDFAGKGLTCFRLTVGIPIAGEMNQCLGVAVLESVKKKDGIVFARIRLIQVMGPGGELFKMSEGGIACLTMDQEVEA